MTFEDKSDGTIEEIESEGSESYEGKIFSCPKCDKSFNRPEHRRRHMRCHTGEKPFICLYPNCNKQFARSDNMLQHIRSHALKGYRSKKVSNEELFEELEKKGCSFRRKTSMKSNKARILHDVSKLEKVKQEQSLSPSSSPSPSRESLERESSEEGEKSDMYFYQNPQFSSNSPNQNQELPKPLIPNNIFEQTSRTQSLQTQNQNLFKGETQNLRQQQQQPFTNRTTTSNRFIVDEYFLSKLKVF